MRKHQRKRNVDRRPHKPRTRHSLYDHIMMAVKRMDMEHRHTCIWCDRNDGTHSPICQRARDIEKQLEEMTR